MEMIKTSEFIEQYKQGKISAATLVKMAAFKDELEKGIKEGKLDGLVKQALFPPLSEMTPGVTHYADQIPKIPFLKNLSNWFAADLSKGKDSGILKVVGMGVLGAGFAAFLEVVKGLEGKVQDWTTDLKKPRMLEEMLEVHPDMRELPLDRVKLYFDALLHFSPTMAENPLTAGAYIKQAMKYDHVAQGPLPASVQELSMIEKNRQQAKEKGGPSSYVKTIFQPISGGLGISSGN